jgi:hypothetical protein
MNNKSFVGIVWWGVAENFGLAVTVGSRDSAVGIETALGAGQPKGRSSNPALYFIQTSCGAHTACYPLGTGGFSPGVNRSGREADHSPPTSAKVKKKCNYTSPPHTPCRLQWSLGLRHETSSPAGTLGSWFRLTLMVWMSVLFCV